MRKQTQPRNKAASPLRLNLNLRVKRGKDWTHYKGLSFICEAATIDQAAAFGHRLKGAAQQIAAEMGLKIPGATIIYVPEKAAQDGVTQDQATADPTAARA